VTGADPSVGEQLADWGKVIIIETRGRRTGRPARAAVGFIEEAVGTLLVAASDDRTQWARNLLSDPRCLVAREGRTVGYMARLLDEDARNAAVTGLILKYGTPAERLGAGPAFRLIPLAGEQAESETASAARFGAHP
jgi:deazaflavin-dependent oxidoreductase (nitroreductase family)